MSRRLMTAALVCAALLPTPGVLNAGPSNDGRYAAVAHDYFYAGFAAHPSNATTTGVHSYDRQLDDMSAAAVGKWHAYERATLAKLQEIAPQTLSREAAIDRQMLIYAIDDDLLIDDEQQNWRHNPDRYTQVASNGIYGLIARNFAPLRTRMQDVIAREREMPRLFAQARANIGTVDAATAQASYQDAAGAVDFIAHDVPLAFTSVQDPALHSAFASANAAAAKAVREYANWIAAGPLAHPRGTFAIGADAYRRRLLYEDALDMPVSQYLAIGEAALARTKQQFIATAKRLDPAKSARDVYATLQAKHPSADGLPAAAQQDVVHLRAFVLSHHILTLPAGGDIKVVDTPPFQRSQVFAAADPPGPLETRARQAFYFITPPDPSWPKAQQDRSLGFLNDYALPLISAHEVMPGHFVNYIVDKDLTLSLTRKLLWNSEFGEGWAHYDEQMVVDEGWGNGDPRVRLAQLEAALTREARYVVGVKEHTQGMTVAQATAYFIDNAFMPKPSAAREALRGTQDPMYGYYTLGKLMILKLRADYRRKMGRDFSLQRFHDALLAHGDPPIPLLRPLLLGAADDGKPL